VNVKVWAAGHSGQVSGGAVACGQAAVRQIGGGKSGQHDAGVRAPKRDELIVEPLGGGGLTVFSNTGMVSTVFTTPLNTLTFALKKQKARAAEPPTPLWANFSPPIKRSWS